MRSRKETQARKTRPNPKKVSFYLTKNTLGRIRAGETAGSIISATSGGHNPLLVYEKGNYIGMVWPHKLLYVDKPSFKEKVGPRTVKSAYLTPDDDLTIALSEMLSLRVYVLPVFNGDEITGMITARKILSALTGDGVFNEVSKRIVLTEPLIALENAKIKEVFSEMRKGNHSRVLLVDKDGKLTGVVTRRDIYLSLLEPPRGKQRFSARMGQKVSEYDEGKWETKLDYSLSKLAHPVTSTGNYDSPLAANVKRLLTEKKGSLILVDAQNHPKAILSFRPILKALLATLSKKDFPIIMTDRKKVLDAFRWQEVYDLLAEACAKWMERFELKRMDAIFDARKNAAGKPTTYSLNLKVWANSSFFNSKTQNEELRDVVQEGIERIRKQLRRNKIF